MFKLAIPVLHVSSAAAAEDFYCARLGFRRQFAYRADESRPDPCYMGLARDGAQLHVSSFAGDAVAGGIVYLLVDDVDTLHTELVAKQVAIDLAPTDQSWGNREMYVKDPDGNSIRFVRVATNRPAGAKDVRVSIRPLTEGDESEWMRLRFALWPDYTLDDMRREMAEVQANLGRQPVFVAKRSGSGLCGLVEVSIHTAAPGCKTDRIGYLEAWYVDLDWRGQGVGRRLVKVAEAWAKAQGCREMASDTDPGYPHSPGAHAALGYREVERHFRKDLP